MVLTGKNTENIYLVMAQHVMHVHLKNMSIICSNEAHSLIIDFTAKLHFPDLCHLSQFQEDDLGG